MTSDDDMANVSNLITNTGKPKSNLKHDFVQKHISHIFGLLGTSVGKHPLLYFLVPLFVAATLSVRIYWVHLTTEVEYLYSPINARALKERDAVESLFPPSSEGRDMIKLMRFRRMATVLMEAKDGGSVLRNDIMSEAVRIDNIIKNITVLSRNKTYTFVDLCSKEYYSRCQSNDVLSLVGKIEDIKRKRLQIKYPFEVDEFSQKVKIYAAGLGSVTTDENDYIVDAKAIRLIYLLDYTNEETNVMTLKWEELFQQIVIKIKSDGLRLSLATAESINNEFSRVTEMVLTMILATAIIMVTFAALSCMTTNCVTSKPFVAVGGCISPILGVAVAFGLLLSCGVEYVDVNIIIVFLSLGIGLDDSFVILAAWRRTDSRQEVYIRMSQTYEEASVSITITSITNILSFCIGMSTPYRIVKIYCYYAATAMLFAYVFQITFFGGVLALSGYREKRNCHPLLCITIKKETMLDSLLVKFLYFGCRKDRKTTNNNSKSAISDSFLTMIITPWGKIIIAVVYLLYIVTSSYSLRFIEESFDYRDAIPSNSYLIDYFNMHYKHFTQYPHPIQIVINKTLDYSDKQVQQDIEDMMQNFFKVPNVAGDKYVLNWLKYYLRSIGERYLTLSYRGYNFSDPNDFITGLKNVFLKLPAGRYFRNHIRFNHDKSQIIASRFVVITNNVDTSEQEKTLISKIFSKADSCKYPVIVHNAWFPLYSVMLQVASSSIETMCIAGSVVVAVFFVFIPHLHCIIGIIVTVISIEVGLIGYMSLWKVPFNPISMMSLIVSVGLSVDYSAHISYAYLSCKGKTPDEKIKVAICCAGYPIIQGCVSTILGVTMLGMGPSHLFLIFFKIVTLVMLMAVYHGLFVIPFMLNILEIAVKKLTNRSKRHPMCTEHPTITNTEEYK